MGAGSTHELQELEVHMGTLLGGVKEYRSLWRQTFIFYFYVIFSNTVR